MPSLLRHLPARSFSATLSEIGTRHLALGGPQAAGALTTRDLGVILRTYRRLNGFSQEALAMMLGYDKTYVSMIETGRRTINDVASRRYIADTLALPAHALGVTNSEDADFAAMIQFADSTIRLAEIARRAGRAIDAVNELWPLVARLESRASERHVERETLVVLGQARLALGVSLGTVLPEERLVAAAGRTGRDLAVADRLGDNAFYARTLRMHGNELRKAGRAAAGVARLHCAVATSASSGDRGTALALLARAAGEHGDARLFDAALAEYRALLDRDVGTSMLFNPFTFREIELRGLLNTSRVPNAMRIVRAGPADAAPVAPQWQVIEQVTAGHVLLAGGKRDEAEGTLRAALNAAQANRLPHQVQRTLRAAESGNLEEVARDCCAALEQLSQASARRGLEQVS